MGLSTGEEMNASREFVTCCPACDTSFRVTHEQMEMASGMVRCGACLRIFQADEQLVEAFEDDSAESDPPVTQILDGQCDVDEEEIQSRFRRDWDLYAEEVFGQQSPENVVYVQAVESGEDGFDEIKGDSAESNSSSDETIESESVEVDLPGVGVSEVDLADAALPEEHEVFIQGKLEDVDLSALVSQLDLEDDPESLVGDHVARVTTSPGWYVAMLVLVVSGFMQFAWFNQEIYAQQVEYRSWYLSVCSWINCDLPEYANADELSTSSLIVRSHPDVGEALIIDAIVRNSSRYRQRFPVLQLQFQDIENNPVAQRRFRPENYLAGELRGLGFIPGNTEVRLSLEIVDPGENALGYSLTVIPARFHGDFSP
jgi:predicted Zn finger-like uncharacterized protein